jgi:hypothetical protein
MSKVYQIAVERAEELMNNKNVSFETFEEALDVAFEEIIDECKSLMSDYDC